jgi:regulatory protein
MGASGTAVVAAGGSSFFVAVELLEELGLSAADLVAGAELDEASSSALALAAEAFEAEKRGLSLLARAEQSTFMLKNKLEGREFSRRAVALALNRLTASGLLDDRRFAGAFAASRLSRIRSKAEGPASLVSALRERGIDRAVAAEAVTELLGPDERTAALEKAVIKETKRSGGNKDELRRRLRALGFKSDEIAEFFDRD